MLHHIYDPNDISYYPFSDEVMSVSDDSPTLSKRIKSYLKQNPDPSGYDNIVVSLKAPIPNPYPSYHLLTH